MLELIKKMLANDKIRYLIAGGMTTCVNLAAFFVLRCFTDIERNVCNVIAICMAITFAYFANKFFVFRSRNKELSQTVGEAVSFVSARIVSMAVEVLGFAILCDSFRLPELVSKLAVQLVVLVMNYLFSKLIVFKKERRSFREVLREDYCYYAPALIVLFVMLGVCISEKITPFGPNSLTIVDSLHQYLPFLSDYRDKLLHEGSLFYSWNIALGSNFVSLSAYYLSSPFNYLLMLFGKEHIAAGVTLIITMKLCLTAVSMAYCLTRLNGKEKKNIAVIGIAVCYALSNYVVGYNWNFMWLDCIMIFPLIILGFDRLMRNNDARLYTLSLFYCLYCNYYIGFIICVFLILWFFVYRHKRIKDFFVHGVRFAVYSLISGAMAAFLLIPAYFGIMQTASASAELPKWSWYGNIFIMLRQQLFLTNPITNQTFDGNVNLYCGMFAVFALFVYVFHGGFRLGEKLRRLLLLAFLMVSFNSVPLNFIWHGMHDQYGIPNRFSFLYIFVMLLIAYEVVCSIDRLHVGWVVFCVLLGLAFVAACVRFAGVADKIVIASCGMLLVYAVLCILRIRRVIGKRIFFGVFSGICAIELVVSAAFGFGENGYADYEGHYATSSSVACAYERVKQLADENEVGFYRAELMDSKVLDEVTWHNMPGVGTFCSTVLGEVVTTMGRLGFYTGANEFLYMGSTPFTNSVLGVRYLLERSGDLNNFSFDYAETVSGVGIYENPYPLSVGFCVSDKIHEWNRDVGLPLDNQNRLVYCMTGGTSIFIAASPKLSAESDKCSVSVEGNTINYTPYEAGDASFMVSFYADRTGDYYLNCRGNGINKIRFYVNGEEISFDRYQIQIFHLGRLKKGDYVSVEYCYKNLSVRDATASLYMATFDETAYQDIYSRLSLNQLKVEKYDDGYIYGTVDVADGQTLFTSVPYDLGWRVRVDGRETEYYAAGEAFIGVDMEPGRHIIEMYYVPRGLYTGILISAAACVLFLLGVMHNSDKKRIQKLVKNNNNEIDPKINI